MSQFTLYANQNDDSKTAYPFFANVQNGLLDTLNTRLVIPLTPVKNLAGKNISHLCPTIEFNDETYVLLTQQMTNIPDSALKMPVASLEHIRSEIIAAIDFLITGI